MKVALLTKYGDLAASTRQRFDQYQPFLKEAGFEVLKYPLFNNNYLKEFYDTGNKNFIQVFTAYFKRLKWLISKPDIDLIWLHYELFPYLPGVFEKLISLPGKPIVFDYDDAFFFNYDSNPKWYVRKFLGQKLHYTIGAAKIAFCGNVYLANYARKSCSEIKIVPTVVNTDLLCPNTKKKKKGNSINIGWIGSPTTWNYFEKILPVMKQVALTEDVSLLAMGASHNYVNTHSILNLFKWSKKEEVPFLQSLDIGVMPLNNTPWEKGKCGYKIIQYMACGIPVVASSVGANKDIIDHGVDGFLVKTHEEWRTFIKELINNKNLRQKMGNAGRKKIESKYSLKVWGPQVSEILKNISNGRAFKQ